MTRKIGFGIGIALTILLVSSRVPSVSADPSDNVAPKAPSQQKVTYKKLSSSGFRFASAMDLLAAKCMNCHRPGGGALDFIPYLTSEASWVQANLVVAGQAQNSLLYKYLIGSGLPPPLGTMPLGGTLSAAERNVIADWINQMPDPASMPTPTPVPTIGAGVAFGLNPSQSSPHLGDRVFVKSVLDNVFGPAAASTTDAFVKQYISIFGGACDVFNNPPATGQSDDSCPNLDAQIFVASIVPQHSAARAGQTMKVCNILAFNDAALQYAIQQATGHSDLSYLQTTPVPTLTEIVNAYALFNPQAGAPSSAALGAIASLAQQVAPANYPTCPSYDSHCERDPWRYALLALCYDPSWQVD